MPPALLSAFEARDVPKLLVEAEAQLWIRERPLPDGLEHLFGGKWDHQWYRDRMVGKHWRSAESRAGLRRILSATGKGLGELGRKVALYGRMMVNGALSPRAFLVAASAARHRGEIRRRLGELDEASGSFSHSRENHAIVSSHRQAV